MMREGETIYLGIVNRHGFFMQCLSLARHDIIARQMYGRRRFR